MAESRKHLLELLQGDAGAQFADSNDGWDEDTDVCTWQGVTCTDGKVTMLKLIDSKLEGTIPPSLGDVTTLTHLYLASNSFHGAVPEKVANLPKLEVIDLSFNQLNGTLPSLASTKMQTIELGHNQFTGTLAPNTGEGMTDLEIFDIKYNLITGTIPILAGSFPSLVELDWSNNQFIGSIPAFLGQLTAMKRLFLSNNQFGGIIPVELTNSNLVLEEIYLHGNLLTGTLPAALADLSELQVLFIDSNKLTGTVPRELCERDLNEAFFDDLADEDVDKTYTDLYSRKTSTNKKTSRNAVGWARRLRSSPQGSSRMLREKDPTETRDGCSSIACPAGYQSLGDNNKDGVFPCEPCKHGSLNPYIGSNKCFEINQDIVLQMFYNSTNGEAWVGGENWANSSVPTCEKEGVSCSKNGELTSIELSDMGLSGTLPAQLGYLNHLQTLNVTNNKIGGKLPADLRFAPLKHLDVSENVMTGFVPLGLCQKSGVNGNGKDGIYTCDTIACQPGSTSPIGRADAGASGLKCTSCDGDAFYLGSTACAPTTSSSAITPFGLAGEIVLLVMSLGILFFLVWVYRRSAISTKYINSVYAPPVENRQEDGPETRIENCPSSGALPPSIEIKPRDEYSSDKEESAKTVWFDVTRLT